MIFKKYKTEFICFITATALTILQSLVLVNHVNNAFLPEASKGYVYILSVILSFLFGVSFWFALILGGYSIYKKDAVRISYIKDFFVCFIPLFVILFLIFPGNFKGDEFYVLESVREYRLSSAQGGLHSLFYIMCLRFFPSLFTISFIHIFIISLIYAYVFKALRPEGIVNIILRLVIFLPAVLDGCFFTLRAMIGGWCFLAAAAGIYAYVSNDMTDKTDLLSQDRRYGFSDYRPLIPIAVFSAFAAALRSEYIYLVLLIPEAVILFSGIKNSSTINVEINDETDEKELKREINEGKRNKNKDKYLPALYLFGVTALLYLLINIPNKIATGDSNKYPISLVLNPVSNILAQDEIRGENAYDDIMAINELIDVKAFKFHSSVRNISQYWDIPDVVPEDKLDAFMKGSYDLILNNFGAFLKYRWLTFAHTNGLFPDEMNHQSSPDSTVMQPFMYYGTDYAERYYFSKPLFPALRAKIINLIGARDYSVDPVKTYWYYPVAYNCIPVILLCLGCFVFFLIKKCYKEAYMIFTVSLQLPIVFLTAPAIFFMYYYCFYLSGLFMSVILIYNYFKRMQLKDI